MSQSTSVPLLKDGEWKEEADTSFESDYQEFPISEPHQQRKSLSRGLAALEIIGVLLLGLCCVYLLRYLTSAYPHQPRPGSAGPLRESLVPQIFEERPIFSQPPSDESNAAWAAMIPKGRGFVKVKDENPDGDTDGLYCVSVFHQLHCLDMLRRGYYAAVERADRNPTPTVAPDGGPFSPVPGDFTHRHGGSSHHEDSSSHMEHCFDYLLQALACAADPTLEKRNETISGVRGWGTTHQCHDFETLKKWTEEHRYNDEEGISN
ncbi:hypothetical protein K469DRAFT_151373 [Zopfia rhizophila CBS 207.26]|uniref:Tat pathway signal sequence n=1 Tax=Zopfia rhizophila CBS 207.26 TaxID=1314779 RepID=A0A6A6E5H6_9PEZI|nr:hypothetical protein K469DRAFT_151373 [Zopfia rhizophila CBS 207.26]